MTESGSEPSVVYVSLGSNLGDKKGNCRNGIHMLGEEPGVSILAVSPFYRTEPVDYRDQDWFVNAVVKAEAHLDPFVLLKELMHIETALGRRRDGVRFGPRVIDLDLVLYGSRVIDSSELVVPHPRMHKRRFVLAPICDIDPELQHPALNLSMGQLLDNLDVRNQELVRLED